MSARQRGMALLVVLLMMAIMALLATTAQQYSMQAMMRADSQQAHQQLKWDLLSAEQWFITTQPLDKPAALARQRQFGEQLIHFELQDRQACFNLNALLPQRISETDSQLLPSVAHQVFQHMLNNLGLDTGQSRALMKQLIATVKPDPRINKWRLFDEISQLKALPVVTPDLWRQLQPLLCITPDTRLAININGLTLQHTPLLRALFANRISAMQARSLIGSRPQQGWADLSAMLKNLSTASVAPSMATLQSVVVTRSHCWELLTWSEHPLIFAALRSRIAANSPHHRVTARLYGLSE